MTQAVEEAIGTWKMSVLVKTGKKIPVSNGPNEWDLFLCFRGTTPEVTFYVGSGGAVVVDPYQDAASFFYGRVIGLERRSPEYGGDEHLIVRGIVYKGKIPSDFIFEVDFHIHTRKGEVKFHRMRE